MNSDDTMTIEDGKRLTELGPLFAWDGVANAGSDVSDRIRNDVVAHVAVSDVLQHGSAGVKLDTDYLVLRIERSCSIWETCSIAVLGTVLSTGYIALLWVRIKAPGDLSTPAGRSLAAALGPQPMDWPGKIIKFGKNSMGGEVSCSWMKGT